MQVLEKLLSRYRAGRRGFSQQRGSRMRGAESEEARPRGLRDEGGEANTGKRRKERSGTCFSVEQAWERRDSSIEE